MQRAPLFCPERMDCLKLRVYKVAKASVVYCVLRAACCVVFVRLGEIPSAKGAECAEVLTGGGLSTAVGVFFMSC